MLSQISSPQFTEWQAFSMLEPFGFEVDMFGQGIVAATIANTRANKPKGAKLLKPNDFIPELEQPKEKSNRSFFAELKSMLLLNKGKIK